MATPLGCSRWWSPEPSRPPSRVPGPGPIQGNAVHPCLSRRQGKEKVSYLHPSLEPVLKETLGVIIYQEQVIQVAMAIAGFTPGQADSLAGP